MVVVFTLIRCGKVGPAFLINLSTNEVFPDLDGPATIHENGCFHFKISSDLSMKCSLNLNVSRSMVFDKMMIYFFIFIIYSNGYIYIIAILTIIYCGIDNWLTAHIFTKHCNRIVTFDSDKVR